MIIKPTALESILSEVKHPYLRSAPNMVTLGRLVLTPFIISAIAGEDWRTAFYLFLAAGASDALDGWLAKTFDLKTEIGAILDPLADKALLVSLYVSFAIVHAVPPPIVALMAGRDLLIVGGVTLAWVLQKPLHIRPLLISKINTAMQILFAAALLATKAFGLSLGVFYEIGLIALVVLTLASGGSYVAPWFKHMNM
jgi:cardiolipin synthase